MAINKLGGQVAGGQSIDYRGCFDGAQELSYILPTGAVNDLLFQTVNETDLWIDG